jgi:hypothetical protein
MVFFAFLFGCGRQPASPPTTAPAKDMHQTLDWTKLPTNLSYLAGPAEKYGRYQFEDKIFRFLDRMSQAEKAELTQLLQQTIKDDREINKWLDQYPMTTHPEARLVYFLEHLLALGNDAGSFRR